MTDATTQMRFIHAIKSELERAKLDGISRETLPTAREGQLDGYIAGLRWALKTAART